jgi:hypothetical protein
MATVKLHELLDGKWEDGKRPKDLFERHVSKAPAAYVDSIVAGLSSDKRRVQNGCAELASLVSAIEPALLVSSAPLFVANLDAKEAVLRWEAACTLGNLAAAAERKLVIGALGKLEAALGHESIVLQGHAVRALAKIAQAFPETASRILEALTHAGPRFPGSRVGYLVEAMESFATFPALAPKAYAFAKTYEGSDIRPVASKARRAMKKLGKVTTTKGPRRV